MIKSKKKKRKIKRKKKIKKKKEIKKKKKVKSLPDQNRQQILKNTTTTTTILLNPPVEDPIQILEIFKIIRQETIANIKIAEDRDRLKKREVTVKVLIVGQIREIEKVKKIGTDPDPDPTTKKTKKEEIKVKKNIKVVIIIAKKHNNNLFKGNS